VELVKDYKEIKILHVVARMVIMMTIPIQIVNNVVMYVILVIQLILIVIPVLMRIEVYQILLDVVVIMDGMK